MASPKLFAEVVIAGSYKNLAKSTRGATKELKGFEASTKKMANAVKGALAGIALMGVGMVWDALVDMTKAAQEDAKAVALLNKQMEKSWKATDTTTDAMNDYIHSVSRMTGIMDDDLRPAFGKIVRATKNSSQATAAFDNVLNIAADTGKDVNTVAVAYSKYLAGNKTALYRLIPGLKGAKNEAKYLKETYAGMAELAGKNDPFSRISVVMEDFKEKLGTAFMPLIQQFADWLASDEATAALDDLATAVQDAFKWFGSEEGKEGIKQFGDALLGLVDGLTAIFENLDKIEKLWRLTPLGTIMAIVDRQNNPNAAKSDFMSSGQIDTNFLPNGGRMPTTPITVNPPAAAPPVVNITMDPMTGEKTVKQIKTYAKNKGIRPNQVFG